MNWTVERPRTIAEDDKRVLNVDADSIEEAIELAAHHLYDTATPSVGQVYLVWARVQVMPRVSVPLRSV